VGSRRLRSVQGARELVAARRAPGGALTAVAFTTRPKLKGTKRSAGSSRSFATTSPALRPCISVQGGRGLGRCFATPTWPPPTAGSRVRRRSRAANDAPMFHTTHVPSSVAPHEALLGRMGSARLVATRGPGFSRPPRVCGVRRPTRRDLRRTLLRAGQERVDPHSAAETWSTTCFRTSYGCAPTTR